MDSYGRINILNRAGRRFIKELAPDGLKLGIIEFSHRATLVEQLTEINDATREPLAEKMSFVAGGGTIIHAGVELALEQLRASGNTKGAVILLITDGNEGMGDSEMERTVQRVKEAEIRIDSIAIGDDADENLEEWAQETGGRVWYMNEEDDVTNTQFENAFEASAQEQMDVELQPVSILSEDIREISSHNQTWVVSIDPELGANTTFFLSSSQMSKINITFISPSGIIIPDSNATIRKTDYDLIYRLTEAETGDWKIFARSKLSAPITMSLNVKSFPSDRHRQPIRVSAWIENLRVKYPATAKVFAEIKQNYHPVLNASVVAVIERPDSVKLKVELKDDGLGADAFPNDGIYTSFFTQFSGNGRYSVKAKVTSKEETKLKIKVLSESVKNTRSKREAIELEPPSYKGEFYLDDPDMFIVLKDDESRVADSSLEGYKLESLNRSFVRQQDVGTFELENYNKRDMIPPSQVADLTASPMKSCVGEDTCNRIVELEWTAAGNDAMVGKASFIDVRLSDRPEVAIDKAHFEKSMKVVDEMLIEGSLTNLTEGGSTQRLVIRLPDDLINRSLRSGAVIYAALITIDHDNNPSPISNMAYLSLAHLIPPDRVTDLQALDSGSFEDGGRCMHAILFNWTAAGDSGRLGIPLEIDLRISKSYAIGNETTGEFESALKIEIPNTSTGGSIVQLTKFLADDSPLLVNNPKRMLYAALRTTSHSNETSPLSNVARVRVSDCRNGAGGMSGLVSSPIFLCALILASMIFTFHISFLPVT